MEALDPRLGPLLAGYVRGSAGAAEVLHDAFLERGLEPLPIESDPSLRIERAWPLLSAAVRAKVGCASVRRVFSRFAGEMSDEPALERALEELERAAPTPDDAIR